MANNTIVPGTVPNLQVRHIMDTLKIMEREKNRSTFPIIRGANSYYTQTNTLVIMANELSR
ncbi:hypothetical protein PAAG_04431 [Paracoccidioides lutzii Pb01]|uniref:Uncharacterized protein n=1 Tax=Paracoccidioides lutzii (strain ATCC MYA-826 / Pb01) TaxID=502779 RepID=C1H0Y7_PARBA|nr:hypothetical protein PAAG_04431 [Paracoccidioides lutzii Pb01]EEH33381.2 hypothetical protein PAAG_04431 [Paracoccidioides lutzii Pb01]